MEIRPVGVEPSLLARYARLFAACFPNAKHLDVDYLHWLYACNPAGTAIGFDAWEGDELAAHYVCVPANSFIDGRPARTMLSLNTATDPRFQGRGLFTRLAEATYEAGAAQGVAAAYGVANANSTPGFVRKLGFTLIRPLDALVGAGLLDGAGQSELCASASFRRDWTPDRVAWRISNPARPYRLVRLSTGGVGAEASSGRPALKAWDELPAAATTGLPVASASFGLRLHLGLRPAGWSRQGVWFSIPDWLRPSPLNLVFRPLAASTETPSADSIVLGQMDFDAF